MKNQRFDPKTVRQFPVIFGELPIVIVVPKSYSKDATRRFLTKRLTAHTESLIDSGVWERDGSEEIEIELTIDELMETY